VPPQAVPGIEPHYVYSGLTFGNMADALILECGGPSPVEIDRVVYDGGVLFPSPTGRSMTLDAGHADAMSNNDGTGCCSARNCRGQYDGLNYGTPAAANPL